MATFTVTQADRQYPDGYVHVDCRNGSGIDIHRRPHDQTWTGADLIVRDLKVRDLVNCKVIQISPTRAGAPGRDLRSIRVINVSIARCRRDYRVPFYQPPSGADKSLHLNGLRIACEPGSTPNEKPVDIEIDGFDMRDCSGVQTINIQDMNAGRVVLRKISLTNNRIQDGNGIDLMPPALYGVQAKFTGGAYRTGPWEIHDSPGLRIHFNGPGPFRLTRFRSPGSVITADSGAALTVLEGDATPPPPVDPPVPPVEPPPGGFPTMLDVSGVIVLRGNHPAIQLHSDPRGPWSMTGPDGFTYRFRDAVPN